MNVTITTEWRTPAGRMRNVPLYSATVTNAYLRTTRTFRGANMSRVQNQATAQSTKWLEQERRRRKTAAEQNSLARAQAEAIALDEEARELVEALKNILEATLTVDDRIDWDSFRDTRSAPVFSFEEMAPVMPDATPKEIPKPFHDV